jgi:hypothetical protein
MAQGDISRDGGEGPDSLVFFGPVSKEFERGRVEHWASYSPQIRHALSARNITLAAAETLPDDLRRKLPASRSGGGGDFIVPKQNGTDEFYAINAPSPHDEAQLRPAALSRTVARVLDRAFGFSRQPGFQLAVMDDVDATVQGIGKRVDSGSTQKVFLSLWMERAEALFGGRQKSAIQRGFPRSWDWVRHHTPSPLSGFALDPGGLNETDRAHKTPLETMLFPPSAARTAGLLPGELATMLRSGANPFRPNAASERSPVEELIDREDNSRLAVVIAETDRRGSRLAGYVTAPAQALLHDYVRAHFPRDSREWTLEAIAAWQVPEPYTFWPRPGAQGSGTSPGL